MARNDTPPPGSNITPSEYAYWKARGRAKRAGREYQQASEAFSRRYETFKTSKGEYVERKGEYTKEYSPWIKQKARAGLTGIGKAFVGPRPLAPRTIKKKKKEYITESGELITKQKELKATSLQLVEQQKGVQAKYQEAKALGAAVPTSYMVYSSPEKAEIAHWMTQLSELSKPGVLEPTEIEGELSSPALITAEQTKGYNALKAEPTPAWGKTSEFLGMPVPGIDRLQFETREHITGPMQRYMPGKQPEITYTIQQIPEGWRETEKTASMFVEKYTPEGKATTPMGKFLLGAYEGARDKPLQTVATFGVARGVSLLAGSTRVQAMTRPIPTWAKRGAGIGMGSLYGTSVISRVTTSTTPYETAGRLTSTEILPMYFGFKSGQTALYKKRLKALETEGIATTGIVETTPRGLAHVRGDVKVLKKQVPYSTTEMMRMSHKQTGLPSSIYKTEMIGKKPTLSVGRDYVQIKTKKLTRTWYEGITKKEAFEGTALASESGAIVKAHQYKVFKGKEYKIPVRGLFVSEKVVYPKTISSGTKVQKPVSTRAGKSPVLKMYDKPSITIEEAKAVTEEVSRAALESVKPTTYFKPVKLKTSPAEQLEYGLLEYGTPSFKTTQELQPTKTLTKTTTSQMIGLQQKFTQKAKEKTTQFTKAVVSTIPRTRIGTRVGNVTKSKAAQKTKQITPTSRTPTPRIPIPKIKIPGLVLPKGGKKKRVTKKDKKFGFKIKRMAKYKPSLIGLTMPEVTKRPVKKFTGIGIRRVIKK